MWRKSWANNASKEQMGFNSGLKGLNHFWYQLFDHVHLESFKITKSSTFYTTHLQYIAFSLLCVHYTLKLGAPQETSSEFSDWVFWTVTRWRCGQLIWVITSIKPKHFRTLNHSYISLNFVFKTNWCDIIFSVISCYGIVFVLHKTADLMACLSIYSIYGFLW
jgi:hypothetical protein